MAISGFDGMYFLECDVCGADSGCDFDDFYDAVNYKKDKDNRWISKKVDGEWQDVCPECQDTPWDEQ